jgi:probable F420-dependent oxidoreductase
MKFGLHIIQSDEDLDPAVLATLAEHRGFESIFFGEHTHIPIDTVPLAVWGEEVPREYVRTLDPLVAMSVAAQATTEIRVGTGICLVAQRDPLATAKALASIDHLSGGRVLFGIGAGWNRAEMRNHGVEPSQRFRVMREHVEAITTIWAEDEASYQGEHVNFGPVWSWPKPVQDPRPPVLVGGMARASLEFAAAVGDEWAPPDLGEEETLLRLGELRDRCEEVGRDPIPVTLFATQSDSAVLAKYQEGGVHRALFMIGPRLELGELERSLDELADTAGALGAELGFA